MNEREKGINFKEDGTPDFAETINRTETVGILSDGTWAVGWNNQPKKEDGTGKLAWSHHETVWSVLNQQGRIIKKFNGVYLLGEEESETTRDPGLGVTLLDVKNAISIPGENEFATSLSSQIERVMTLTSQNRITQDIAKGALSDISRQIGEVRNPHKKNAKVYLSSNLSDSEPVDLPTLLQASDSMLKRAQEGTSIVKSLYTRGSQLLDWVNREEIRVSRLRYLLEQAIRSIDAKYVTPQTINHWEAYFYGENGAIADLEKINGKPYYDLQNRREIKRLKNARSIILGNDLQTSRKIMGDAYQPLLKVYEEKLEREKSGKYHMYNTRKKRY